MVSSDTRYPFNPSGQLIDASGLVALCDGSGVSGTPVKDSQRTKTRPETTTLLTVLWVPNVAETHGRSVLQWYLEQHHFLAGPRKNLNYNRPVHWICLIFCMPSVFGLHSSD